jgi:short-subunit dehydrogenase
VTAEKLAAAGAAVIVVARDSPALGEVEQMLPTVSTIAADVGDAVAVHAAIEVAAGRLGGLDAVVANAGAATYGPFTESNPDDYEQTIGTTLIGVMHVTHAALPRLAETRGTLVVVGSVAGRLPTPWLSAYAGAKHAVRGFLRSLVCELRALRIPVAVALVAPGPVDTPFWRRARTPDSRLPPEVPWPYPPDDVAAEILRALEGAGPLERTVGGLFVPAIVIDALLPNLVLRPLGVTARLGWRARNRHPHSTDDVFTQPTTVPTRDGGLTSRRSALQAVRSLLAPGDP